MDFVILKVNGKDVSNSSHEDAVRCFESAEEPIIVEVLRRQPSGGGSGKGGIGGSQQQQQQIIEPSLHSLQKDLVDRSNGGSNSNSSSSSSSSSNSSIEIHEKQEKKKKGADEIAPVETYDVNLKEVCCNPANSPPLVVSTAVQTDWAGLIEEELMLDPLNIEEQPCNDSFEDFLPQHINFEEVTLRKSASAEKLGLTVCYSSGSGSEDADTEVYISEIVPESLAARDGRLREGDQILRVNGKDVANKEQTECLFAETKNAVTLLVSRCYFQDEEYDERRLYQQESPSSSPDNNPAYQNSMIEQLIRQQQESDDPIKESDNKSQNSSKITTPPPPVPSHTSEEKKQWMQDAVKECSKKIDLINLGRPQQPGPPIPPIRLMEAYTSHVWSDTEHIYETIPESDSEPIYSSPYEHRHWIQTHRNIGTTNNKSQNTADQTKPWNWSSKSNSSGEEKESSSAYNTGESCHSNPLTLELQQGEKDHHKSTLVLCQPQQKSSQQTKSNLSDATTVVTGCSCPLGSSQYSGKVTKTQPSARKNSHRLHKDHRDVTNASTLPADTMYTNAANLQQTILLQQELFKQALMTRRSSTSTQIREGGGGTRKSKSHGNFQAPNLTRYQFVGSQQVCASAWVPPEDKCEVQMEWKVKRRPDGTRYIARRPVRNRILRNRAIKISEERAGHTTEDDTMSEMKVGRYWSKEERKRQLERARERKQRHQELQQQQQSPQQTPQQQQQQQSPQQQQQQQQQQLPQLQTNDVTIGDCSDDKTAKKPLNIVEVGSQKKMARKKTTIEDFTTVQEMLVHGNRVGGGSGPGTGGKLMGLLSVTTV